MIGMGIGIVIRCGASTGGMDIPPLVLNKKFGLPVSVMLYVFDFIILISQMLFTNKEEIVYGILLVLIYTVILDKVLLMGSTRTKVEIMTEKYEELNRLIQERLDRGTTLVYTQTGYLRNDQPMILTVVSNRELMRLNQLVQEIDPHAFMIIGNVNEVRGRGFSQQKVYKKETTKNKNTQNNTENKTDRLCPANLLQMKQIPVWYRLSVFLIFNLFSCALYISIRNSHR